MTAVMYILDMDICIHVCMYVFARLEREERREKRIGVVGGVL